MKLNIDNATTVSTGMTRPKREPFCMELLSRETGEFKPGSFDHQQLYRVSLVLKIDFWATKAEYDAQLNNAKQLLASHLYSDVIHELHTINAILGDDRVDDARQKIMALCTSLTKCLLGVPAEVK